MKFRVVKYPNGSHYLQKKEPHGNLFERLFLANKWCTIKQFPDEDWIEDIVAYVKGLNGDDSGFEVVYPEK